MRYLNTVPERTYLRVDSFFSKEADLGTDAVIVYGLDQTTEDRIKDWVAHGYTAHFMTDLSWGDHSEYLAGKYDGKQHYDEIQTTEDGTYVLHGVSSPYLVPTLNFTDYLSEKLKKVIDMGVRVIFLREPVFFTKSGYCDAFKTEWEIYYGDPWQAPNSSEDAQFKASKLKAYLLRRCIVNISTRLKYYARKKYNCQIKIYSVLNSFISYSQMNIITPGKDLATRPQIDGFAAQVLPETLKTPKIYKGVRKELVFETAYIEYGIMQALAANTEKEMIFIHNPTEDTPVQDWTENRSNYEKTLIASLLQTQVSKYEVCRFPEKIFKKKEGHLGGKSVPHTYKTILLTVMDALKKMKQQLPPNGQDNAIGIFMSDTAMFQREYPDGSGYSFAYADSIVEFSCFYGLCLPLLMNGLPLRPMILENLTNMDHGMNDCKIIVLSYEFMKPLSPAYHYVISSWVRSGGVLIYVGEDSDSFNKTDEWWMHSGCSFSSPAGHLFDVLGIDNKIKSMRKKNSTIYRMPNYGIYDVGNGAVAVLDANPAKCAQDPALCQMLIKIVFSAAEKCGVKITPQGYFTANRGPYKILATLNEEFTENLPLNGNFINLLSENLEYETFIVAEPNSYHLLYDLDAAKPSKTEILACSAYTEQLISDEDMFSFSAKAPENMNCVCRIWLKSDATILVNGKETAYVREKNTVLLNFPGGENKIEIIYRK